MMQARKIILTFVFLCVIILMFLVRRSEGVTSNKNTCRQSLSTYDANSGSYVSGVVPPLDPKKCKDIGLVGRGKTTSGKSRCYTVVDGKWKQHDKATTCPSWVKIVDWKSKGVRDKIQGSPFRRPKGYKTKLENTDYKGDKNLGFSKQKNATDCGQKCDGTANCVAFSMRKAKDSDGNYECFLLDQARKNQGTYTLNDFLTFEKSTGYVGNSKTVDGTSLQKSKKGKMCKDAKITTYTNANYKDGDTVYTGCTTFDVNGKGVSSVRIPQGLQVEMTRDGKPSWTYYGDQDFSNDGEWTDRIRTMKVSECTTDACWSRSGV